METDLQLHNFTDELMEQSCLYCVLCMEILRPPVMLIENVGNICCICYEEKNESMNWRSLNNSALENILKLLKIPCKFKSNGCTDRFSCHEIVLHQSNCKYRPRLCSMFKFAACRWAGHTPDFIDHFKASHGEHIIHFDNNVFFLETSIVDLVLVKLLVMKHQTLILRMKTNPVKNKLFYMVCSVNDEFNSFCEYSVKHKGESDNYVKTKSKVLSSYHIYTEFDENMAVEVDLDSLRQISNVMSDSITNIFKLKIDDRHGEGIDEKILHFFECPVCKNYMKPPIYQCQSGHSICNLCRPRLDKCPTCRSIYGNIRNYSLEGLTAGVLYPCIYHDSGCPEVAGVNGIIKHESECTFKPCSCPFTGCSSTGNQDTIITHLINCHFDSVIYSGSTGYTESFRLDQNCGHNKIFDRKCIIAFDHIFRLTCKRVGEHCLMAAELFGCNDNAKTFVYEVAIIDMRRPEKKLIRTDYCLKEMPEDELFKKCIMFPNTVLASYSNHGMITFHFMIKEK